MTTAAKTRFDGFPPEALRFYAALERENNNTFWQANKSTYERACQQPMQALLAELEGEFGPGRLHRPVPRHPLLARQVALHDELLGHGW
jgi:uncharacterized protein (DUF2461 family)